MQPGFSIAAVGELLWDLLPDGSQLGGAPANFAVMCAHLAAADSTDRRDDEVFLVSRVGDDPLGRHALHQLAALSVNPDHISIDPEHATGSVTVKFDSGASPDYAICENVAWDYLPETPQSTALAPALDAICFGTLAQRSEITRRTLRSLVEATRPDCMRVFDVNLRDPYWTPESVAWGCAHATILKMNHEEVPRVVHATGADVPASALDSARELLRQFPIELVAITRGAKGSLLVTRKAADEHPGVAARVVDPVGAGDAFTAAITICMLRGLPLPLISQTANRWGAWAAAQRGGMPGDQLRQPPNEKNRPSH